MSDRKFRFETVHRVRKLQEKTRLRELGALMVELERARELRNEIREQRRREATDLVVGLREGRSAAWSDMVRRRLEYLDHQVEEILEQEKSIHGLIAEKQKEVELAHRNRKMFDRLEEHHLDDTRLEQAREESAAADEVATMRFDRKQRESAGETR